MKYYLLNTNDPNEEYELESTELEEALFEALDLLGYSLVRYDVEEEDDDEDGE